MDTRPAKGDVFKDTVMQIRVQPMTPEQQSIPYCRDVVKNPAMQIRVQPMTPQQRSIHYRHTYISPWSFTHQRETLPFPSFHPAVDDHWFKQSCRSQAAGSQ